MQAVITAVKKGKLDVLKYFIDDLKLDPRTPVKVKHIRVYVRT